ncbi:hypothetical protein ACFLRP_01080 [Bacteroidota bacterium]
MIRKEHSMRDKNHILDLLDLTIARLNLPSPHVAFKVKPRVEVDGFCTKDEDGTYTIYLKLPTEFFIIAEELTHLYLYQYVDPEEHHEHPDFSPIKNMMVSELRQSAAIIEARKKEGH